MAVPPYYNDIANETYILRARDADGLYTDAPLMVNIDSENLVQVSHMFSMTIRTDLALFTRDLSHIVWWVGNLTSYFNNADIMVLNITGPSVTIAWTNSSIISPYTCPTDTINSLYQSMTTGDRTLSQSLPQYLVSSLTLELVGICKDFTTSTSTTAATTTTPQTVTSTAMVTNQTSAATVTTSEIGVGGPVVTESSKRVVEIVVPLAIILLLVIIIIIVIVVVRRRKRYKGKSHFDGEGNMFAPGSPVMIEDDADDDIDAPFNELYDEEGFINDTYFPVPSPKVARDPPPRYIIPPPFPPVRAQPLAGGATEMGPL